LFSKLFYGWHYFDVNSTHFQLFMIDGITNSTVYAVNLQRTPPMRPTPPQSLDTIAHDNVGLAVGSICLVAVVVAAIFGGIRYHRSNRGDWKKSTLARRFFSHVSGSSLRDFVILNGTGSVDPNDTLLDGASDEEERL
jgi:hypothetical protein